MDSDWLLFTHTVINLETKASHPFSFSQFPHFSCSLVYGYEKLSIVWYHVFEWTADLTDADFPHSMCCFSRRKLNWLVTLCTRMGIISPLRQQCSTGCHFSQTYLHAFLCGFRHIKGIIWHVKSSALIPHPRLMYSHPVHFSMYLLSFVLNITERTTANWDGWQILKLPDKL